MPKESVSTKEKRSSLIRHLLILVGAVIILFNVIQLLFVTKIGENGFGYLLASDGFGGAR